MSALIAGLLSAQPMAASAATDLPDRLDVPSGSEVAKDLVKYPAGKYIVTLKDEPASTYTGGVSGYSATKPKAGKQLNARSAAVKDYTAFLKDTQESLSAKVGAKTLYNYTVAYNGFAAKLTSEEAARLSKSSAVAAVTPNERFEIQATNPDAEPQTSGEYLGITTPGGVWDSIGGVANAGKGVVVGVLDTGIAPENPSFSGDPLSTTPSLNKPYVSGTKVVYAKSDGNTFSSTQVTGTQFDLSDYNTKIIGAQYFVEGFGASYIGSTAQGEYLSPRDGDGHGSHTGSTAVGNPVDDVTVTGKPFGSIAGVAPAAKIAAYKVCWSGQAPDPYETLDDGCFSIDLVAAIDRATADGVDVINYSIGGGSAETVYSPTDQAFLNAASAGVFVSASAGNSGPAPTTTDHAAPWVTTVAASTIPSYEATLELGNGAEYVGASISVSQDESDLLAGDLVLAEANPASGKTGAQANLCLGGSLSANVAGKIVVCERGNNARAQKSDEVQRAGGIGMVLLNIDAGDTVTDDHVIPSIHIDAPYRAAVRAYATGSGATATFHPGNITDEVTAVPQVAGFSSRGPVDAAGSDVLKPDIIGPGVSILAAGPNSATEDPTYEFLSGTSMSAPHIAGLGALYLGQHPLATPAEIKSALSTTATDTVDATGKKTTDPFAQGAGQVNPRRYLNPGLVYLSGVSDWKRYLVGTGEASFDGVTAIDPSNLNLPSIAIGDLSSKQTITRTLTSKGSGTWKPKISIPGVTTKVSPSSLRFTGAGQSKKFTVSFERKTAKLDKWATGFLTWTKSTSTKTTVRIPLAVHPTTVKAPESVSGTGTSGTASVSVTPGFTGTFKVNPLGLAQGLQTPNEADPDAPYTDIAYHDDDDATPETGAYLHEVLDGTTFARFDVEPLEESIETDLDLYILYSPTFSNNLDDYEEVASSATASAGESVEIDDPEPGFYVSYVDFFSAPEGGAPFKEISYLLNPETVVGNLTATPSTVAAKAGVAKSITLRWGGLDPDSFFLGFIYYGTASDVTNLYVTTGDALAPVSLKKPGISGKTAPGETVTATVGNWDADTDLLDFEYQWLKDGDAISGATSKQLVIPADLLGHKLGLIVTATLGEDGPSTVVQAAQVTVKVPSKTSFTFAKNPVKHTRNAVVKVKIVQTPAGDPLGKVTVKYGNKSKVVTLKASNHGVVSVKLPKLKKKTYTVTVTYSGSGTVAKSVAASKKLRVK